jgi:HAD superfamily hydrolase (TIGR01549 family)
MYSWVLLDWDGCIADTLHLWIKAYEKVLPKYGISTSPDDIWKKLCIGNVPKQYAISDFEQCRRDIGETATELFEEASLYENVKTTLETITSHTELAIVSNTRSHLLHPVLKRHQLDTYFSSIITQEDVAKPKPHPEGLLKTMELLGADPKRTLFVGDSDKDLEVARHGGVDSALFYPAKHEQLYDLDHLRGYGPTHVLRDFHELEQLVR